MTSNLAPYKMKDPQLMVPKSLHSSDMARPAGVSWSTFGFQCCLFFLLASWELGATSSRETQKAGESPTPSHLFPPAPDPSALHSAQRSPDLPRPGETPKPKRRCNTTRGSKPIRNLETIGHKNSTTHHDTPPKQNISTQGKDPMSRSGRSISYATFPTTRKSAPGEKQPTSAPKRKTTCKTTPSKSRATRSSSTTTGPVGKTGTTSANKRTNSHKTTTASHNSVNSEIHRKTTSSPIKDIQSMNISQTTTRTPGTSEVAKDERTTSASDKPVIGTAEPIKETTSAKEVTGVHTTPTKHVEGITLAGETTKAHPIPTVEHGGETTLAGETTRTHPVSTVEHGGVSTLAGETTKAHPVPTVEHGGETTLAGETTRTHTMSVEHGGETTLAGETTRDHPVPTVEHGGETTLAGETTRAHPVPTGEHGGETTLAGETTRAHPVPTVEHGRETTLAGETTRTHTMLVEHRGETTLTHEKITQVSGNSTVYPEETTSTTEKNTRIIENLTIYPNNTTLTTQTVKTSSKSTKNPGKTEVTETTRPPVKITGDKSTATISLHFNKTEVTHQGLIGSLALTTSSILSKTPSNQSLPYQSNDGSQGGVHAGVTRENDSFPPWAIVIVVLVAVILLLVFLGLVFMVSCVTRARHTLTRNAEDDDPEDKEGPNSYPVYLMEQQNLQMNQIPSPR